jgi:hypothetical protein
MPIAYSVSATSSPPSFFSIRNDNKAHMRGALANAVLDTTRRKARRISSEAGAGSPC